MKTLVTGANGFIGKWLVSYLRNKGDNIFEFTRQRGFNTLQKETVVKAFDDFKPDRIFHLAAQSNIPLSFQKPNETLKTNVFGTLNFLEAMKEKQYKGVFLSVGSSSEYGSTTSDKPLNEDSPLTPSSPYALSKVTQYHLVRLYRTSYHLNLIHVRPFAIVGPGKQGDAVSDFAKGVVQIERGLKKELIVGNIANVRDFMDVRDAIRAMDLISRNAECDVYNICTGKGTALKTILQTFIRMTQKKIHIVRSSDKKRSTDDYVILGNSERLQSIGFGSEYSLDESLKDVLQFWRIQA